MSSAFGSRAKWGSIVFPLAHGIDDHGQNITVFVMMSESHVPKAVNNTVEVVFLAGKGETRSDNVCMQPSMCKMIHVVPVVVVD